MNLQTEMMLEVSALGPVSALLDAPQHPSSCLVLAHGAGAGMRHVFLESLATRLALRQIAVLRYQFPAMERGTRRPDSPANAHATVRAAVQAAAHLWPGLPLFAGGKSFGGRMTSQTQAIEPLPGVLGLVLVGFPLHPAGAASIKRAEHFSELALPLLFLQGTRDALAEMQLIKQVVSAAPDASLIVIDDADHSFHVRRKSGSNDGAVLDLLADSLAHWISAVIHQQNPI